MLGHRHTTAAVFPRPPRPPARVRARHRGTGATGGSRRVGRRRRDPSIRVLRAARRGRKVRGVTSEQWIATVWIDNPPVNVLSSAVIEAVGEQLGRLDPATRVVVLRGRGERAFSAGADLAGLAAGAPLAEIQQLANLIESLAQPVVAAIHGYCLGGGLELALACDLRVARSDAQLALPETGLGLIPGGGGSQRAPRLIGPGRAAWLIMSGERIPAVQAEAWGLVEFVVDDLDAGVAMVAGRLARNGPSALARVKRLLLATRERRDDALELDAFGECVRDGEGQEGIAAFLAKRAPSWREG